MKNVNIMRVLQFSGEGGHKKIYIYGELPKKGLGQFAEDLTKNKKDAFFFGGGWGGGGWG